MMNQRFCVFLAAIALAGSLRAAVLPPEKLLPKDTVGVLTAPDLPKLMALATNSTLGQFWRCPDMQPFRKKFEDKFSAEVGGSLQTNLGMKLDDLWSVAQGQATVAVFANDDADKSEDRFAPILLLDSKDHSDQLKKLLDGIRKKWSDAGKQMKADKIHGFEFTTFTSQETAADTNSTDGDSSAKPAPKKSKVSFGQVDSLFILSPSAKAIDKVLNRIGGGLTPALEEQPAFQGDFNAHFRAAPVYAWINVKAVTDSFAKSKDTEDPGAPGSFNFSTILSASGLNDVASASVTCRTATEGLTAQVFVTVPEDKRHGLIKAFAAVAKDAGPPAFVPADAIKYWRWRVNLRQTWETLQQMLTDINPSAAGMVDTIFAMAGKDKDEKYDLKAELLGNLGDDVITYGKAPKGATAADVKSAPSIVLIGSPNADALAGAIKVALGMIGQATGGIKEQEFLGRTIYSLSIPAGKGAPTPISFAASGGYIAFSSDTGMVEEYLRSNEGKAKPLSDTPGLADAAQKVGGTGTGFFEFDNYAESMKSIFGLLHSEDMTLNDLVSAPNVSNGPNPAEQLAKVKQWADFTLLPPFDAVSKYFYFSVQSVTFTSQGFSLNIFSPTPPKLK